MNKNVIPKQLRLELLGHIFKSKQEYGIAVFGFYTLLFFGIGLLTGIVINLIFKSLKTTKDIRISPFLIGIWSAFLGAYISSDYLYITKRAHIVVDRFILFGLVFLGFYILSIIIGGAVSLYVKSRTQEVPSSILKASIVIFISIIGLFIAFQSIGLSISPLLTTLGVGTVVIGLALQDTLSNFLSGFYILLSKNIRVGDYIKFDTYEGYVEDIYWRTTHVRTLSGNVIVIPNSKLTSSVITNYHLPYENMAVVFSFSVCMSPVHREHLKLTKLLMRQRKEEDKNGNNQISVNAFFNYKALLHPYSISISKTLCVHNVSELIHCGL